MAFSSSSWIVQILFGRYQSYVSTISWTEVIVLVVIGVVMVYLYLFFLRLKFAFFSRRLSAIPRSHLPLNQRELSRRMYAVLINEMVRVDEILDQGLVPAQTTKAGDPGWGAEGSRIANVHFNTSIAKSFNLLENTALSRRPGLKHWQWRTIREYVQQLRKAFPGLKQQLCDGRHTAPMDTATAADGAVSGGPRLIACGAVRRCVRRLLRACQSTSSATRRRCSGTISSPSTVGAALRSVHRRRSHRTPRPPFLL